MGELVFGPFSLDPSAHRLRRGNADLTLRPQAFRALNLLIQNSGRYVQHQQMIREAWDGTSVSRNTVAVTIAEVKKVLQEYGSWIQCRPKLGYRLEIPQREDLIQVGWHLWNRRTREGFDKALACFQQAAQENPKDFRAFEGQALTYLLLCTYGMRPLAETYPKFLEAHTRAVEIRGLTPALRADRGHALHICERKLNEAEADLLQALREEPNLGTTYVRLAMLYCTMERLDEALEMVRQGRIAEPLCPVLPSSETFVRLCRREFAGALECGKNAIDLHPYHTMGRVHYAQALEAQGRIDEAYAQLRLACVISPDLPWLRAVEGACFARNGRRIDAELILDELVRLRANEYVDAYFLALLLESLGRRDEAFDELQRARRENSASLFQIAVDGRMGGLKKDGRYRMLQRRLFGSRRAVNSVA